MIERYIICCDCERPEWPFVPVTVPCGSARTIGVTGIKPCVPGVTVTGCRVRIINADGESLVKTCRYERGIWVVTFPASHFQNYGTVKNGVIVIVDGKDENGVAQFWISRVGDLRVSAVDADSVPGGETTRPADVYHKSEVVDGVQHYKKEVLVYSPRQNAWGADYVGDYVFVGGAFIEFNGNQNEGEGE